MGKTESNKRPSSSLPSEPTKHQKSHQYWHWNDDYVEINENSQAGRGIQCVNTYEAIGTTEGKNLETINRRINNTGKHTIWNTEYIYYPGFKKGLTTILSRIHEDNAEKALVFHGIPKVGKSSLANNLAYYLATEGSIATVVKMDNQQKISKEDVAGSLERFFSLSGWLILDQVNVHKIDFARFLQILVRRTTGNPVIVFTSGHFAPPDPHWTEHNFIKMKAIDMRVDEAVVEALKKVYHNDKIETRDLLQITNVFGHVHDIVSSTALPRCEPMTFSALEEHVYKNADLSNLLTCHPNLLWMLWPEFCSAKEEDIATRNNPKDWRLTPQQVQLLDYALNTVSDTDNLKTRMFVNWLHIDGDGNCDDNQNDGFYEHAEYHYYFPCLKKLHTSIRKAHKLSPEDKFKKLVSVYELMDNDSDTGARAVQGNLFEAIIRLQCLIASEKQKRKMGLTWDGIRSVNFIEVHDILEPTKPCHLCEILEEKRKTSTGNQRFWCDLNAQSRGMFPGYDFAFVKVADGKYKIFELLQATINAKTHKVDTMLTTLGKIETELGDTFSNGAKVEPFFLSPFDEERAEAELLPCKTRQVQVLNMIRFN